MTDVIPQSPEMLVRWLPPLGAAVVGGIIPTVPYHVMFVPSTGWLTRLAVICPRIYGPGKLVSGPIAIALQTGYGL